MTTLQRAGHRRAASGPRPATSPINSDVFGYHPPRRQSGRALRHAGRTSTRAALRRQPASSPTKRSLKQHLETVSGASVDVVAVPGRPRARLHRGRHARPRRPRRSTPCRSRETSGQQRGFGIRRLEWGTISPEQAGEPARTSPRIFEAVAADDRVQRAAGRHRPVHRADDGRAGRPVAEERPVLKDSLVACPDRAGARRGPAVHRHRRRARARPLPRPRPRVRRDQRHARPDVDLRQVQHRAPDGGTDVRAGRGDEGALHGACRPDHRRGRCSIATRVPPPAVAGRPTKWPGSCRPPPGARRRSCR